MNIYTYNVDDKSCLLFEVNDAYISSYQVEIINNNLDILVLPVRESQLNNKAKFEVNITNKKSIKELISNNCLSYNEFLNIMTKICEIELKCEDYLLHPQNLIINSNTIFIDNNTGEIYIVYLPIKNSSLSRDLEEFKKYVVELSGALDERSTKEEVDAIKSITQYLYSPNITFVRLKRYLESLQQRNKEQNLVVDTKKEEVNEDTTKNKKKTDSLLKKIFTKNKNKKKNKEIQNKEIEVDNREKIHHEGMGYLTISGTTTLEKRYIDKDVFLLGRMPDAVDYAVNSNAIGRVHARIEKIDNNYYLTDLASKNGTYINGVRLSGSEKHKLENGTEIKIANVILYFNR